MSEEKTAELASKQSADLSEEVILDESVAGKNLADIVSEETSAETTADGTVAENNARDPDYKWYILQAYAQYESRVEKTVREKLRIEKLEHLVQQIFIPSENVTKTKGGKHQTVNQKYFPGYILIQAKLTPQLWHLLMSTSRISGFVGGTQKNPLPLDEKELEKIVQQIDSGAQQAVLEEEYVVGQKVMISEGPFNNFNGTIDEINREKRKLKVLVSIFGRPTPVEIEFDKVKSI